MYFDHAATSFHKPPQVAEAVYQSFSKIGNAGRGAHAPTLNAARLIYDTRQKLADLFEISDASRIAFTSNATESLNIAINGLFQAGDHVITTVCEHNSVLRPLYRMEQQGVELSFLPADEKGRMEYDKLKEIYRENTKDNTPAIIHYSIVEGDKVKIKVAPKGFGSENMSRVFMLKPADGIEGVKNAILTAVKDAGPNSCPPMIVGVGVGGTFEKCALMAKEALTREVGSHSDIPWVKELEEEMLDKINRLGIGPGGLGGTTTALAVNVNTYPTHIAGLPVGINICCHVNRHIIREV